MTFFIRPLGELVIFHKQFFIIIYALFFLWFSLIGFFLDLHSGIIWGTSFAAIMFMVFSFWGEKFILYFAAARYVTDDEILLNQVKNFSCHLGIKEVRIFSSAKFSNNVYYANAFFGSPTLIIGKNIFLNFTRNELNSLIYASLLRLKSNDSKQRTVVSLILLVLFMPVYIARKAFFRERKSYLNIFLYPGYFLKSFMYNSLNFSMSLDREVATFEGLRKEYMTAIFKISRLEGSPTHSAGDFLLYELAHIPNREKDVLFDLVTGDNNTTERIESLAGF